MGSGTKWLFLKAWITTTNRHSRPRPESVAWYSVTFCLRTGLKRNLKDFRLPKLMPMALNLARVRPVTVKGHSKQSTFPFEIPTIADQYWTAPFRLTSMDPDNNPRELE